MVVTAHAPLDLTAKLEELVLGYSGSDKLPVYTEDEMRMLLFAQIECITVRDGKTFAIDTKGQQYWIRMRLYEVEKLLPGYFIRINKSALKSFVFLMNSVDGDLSMCMGIPHVHIQNHKHYSHKDEDFQKSNM